MKIYSRLKFTFVNMLKHTSIRIISYLYLNEQNQILYKTILYTRNIYTLAYDWQEGRLPTLKRQKAFYLTSPIRQGIV